MKIIVQGWAEHDSEDCSGECSGHRLIEARATIDELVKHAATLQHPSRLVQSAAQHGIMLVLALGVEEATGGFKLLVERPMLEQLGDSVEKRRQVVVAIADALARQTQGEDENDKVA